MIVRYYSPEAFERLPGVEGDPFATTALFADMCRVNTLYSIMRAGSGHIGSSFSSLDLVSWIYRHELGDDGPDGPRPPGTYFSSKGHDAPGLYAALIALGIIDFDKLHALRRLGGLPGHPDVHTPGMAANTGSLGMGISKAKGMVEANRLTGRQERFFVLTGDGELQEGQIWESLQGTVNRGIGQITVVVDRNGIQSDTWVADVSDLGDLERKFAAFGWAVERCDGHDHKAIAAALSRLAAADGVPGVLIADTVKGRGVSFMESIPEGETLYRFHSGAPSVADYDRAVDELVARCHERAAALGVQLPELVSVEVADRIPARGQRLVDAYSVALCQEAADNDRIVALDGDLVLDTGLIPFRERFPDRFIECGIAEQDMVSQAGGLALRGLLPVVHSFACFLSSRPNEQIYTNATEGTKVVYVGSLAGLVPGGPGHSHQAVRDISSLAAMPGLVAVEPALAAEVGPLLRFCLHEIPGSVYFRLVTPPLDVPCTHPGNTEPFLGRGVVVRPGTDGVVMAAGPVLLTLALTAAERLAAEAGLEIRVVDLPWLNRVDAGWLAGQTADTPLLVALDNHYGIGGQGQMLLAEVARSGLGVRCAHLAVDRVPVCGLNDEVLGWHGLDPQALVDTVLRLAGGGGP